LLEKKLQKYKTYKISVTKKYFIPQFLLLCLFIASCGKANYEPQEYISTNLNEERIELSQEIFNKLKKEHYL